MPGRYIARPLIDPAPAPGPARVVIGLAAVAAGAAAARALNPDALAGLDLATIAGAAALHVGVLAAVGLWQFARLLHRVRHAETAGSVELAAEAPPDENDGRGRDVLSLAVVAIGVFFACVGGGDGAACVLAGLALGLAAVLGPAVGRRLLRRHERRMGRRYFKTYGEPEKVVWLPMRQVAGLD